MLSGIVITKNEDQNLARCLDSLHFCDEVVVVDTGSTDDTVQIAKKHQATVLTHDFEDDFSKLRNWALTQIKSGWVLFVDADEEIPKKLATEITQVVIKNDYVGFMVIRTDFMWNQQLKHGDVGKTNLLRLARRDAGKWIGMVHETWEIEGRVGQLKNPLHHFPHQNLREFLQEVNFYSTLKAKGFFKAGRHTNLLEITLGSVWRFVISYFGKLGFLDGTVGFIHAMVMSFYMFLVSGKLYLLHRGIGND